MPRTLPWRFGDLAIWRFGDLAIWRFGDLKDCLLQFLMHKGYVKYHCNFRTDSMDTV